jgi:hypothetical protein
MTQRKALVDFLAQQLSEKTGADFFVLRGRTPDGMRYALKARLKGTGIFWTFQGGRPVKLAEITRWLASICDMVNMGFICVKPQDIVPQVGKLTELP